MPFDKTSVVPRYGAWNRGFFGGVAYNGGANYQTFIELLGPGYIDFFFLRNDSVSPNYIRITVDGAVIYEDIFGVYCGTGVFQRDSIVGSGITGPFIGIPTFFDTAGQFSGFAGTRSYGWASVNSGTLTAGNSTNVTAGGIMLPSSIYFNTNFKVESILAGGNNSTQYTMKSCWAGYWTN